MEGVSEKAAEQKGYNTRQTLRIKPHPRSYLCWMATDSQQECISQVDKGMMKKDKLNKEMQDSHFATRTKMTIAGL
jgi:hypothetical protein